MGDSTYPRLVREVRLHERMGCSSCGKQSQLGCMFVVEESERNEEWWCFSCAFKPGVADKRQPWISGEAKIRLEQDGSVYLRTRGPVAELSWVAPVGHGPSVTAQFSVNDAVRLAGALKAWAEKEVGRA